MSTEKILEKIKKCLRLAMSDNSNEAATALRQAQKLMEKYNINQDDVDLSNVKAAYSTVGKTQKPPRWQNQLIGVICDAFCVEAIYQFSYFEGMTVKFIGIKAKPEIASFAFVVLYRRLKKDRAVYMKSLKRYKRANKTRKADLFAESWVYAVHSKVSKLAQPKEHTELIDRYKEGKHKDLKDIKSRKHKIKGNDDDAFAAGHLAGKQAHLNHPMKNTEKKQLTGGN